MGWSWHDCWSINFPTHCYIAKERGGIFCHFLTDANAKERGGVGGETHRAIPVVCLSLDYLVRKSDQMPAIIYLQPNGVYLICDRICVTSTYEFLCGWIPTKCHKRMTNAPGRFDDYWMLICSSAILLAMASLIFSGIVPLHLWHSKDFIWRRMGKFVVVGRCIESSWNSTAA